MKALNIFEIFGILVPGTIFTLGLVALYPDALGVLNKREFSFGDFGVILLVSYAIGNLIAGLGIILEKGYWELFAGTPTDRTWHTKRSIFPVRVLDSLQARLVQAKMIATKEDVKSMQLAEWKELVREIYTYVLLRKQTRRLDVFNAQYSMNRGIAAGLLLSVLVEIQKANFSDWRMESVLCFCAALAAYRMHFYRIEYAGELFRQFIHSPLDIPKEPEAKDQDE